MTEPTIVVAIKSTRNATLGISLIGDGKVVITNIAPDGLFAGTDLKVGMEVESINNTKCTTAGHAVALMREAEEHVAIVAWEKDTVRSRPAGDDAAGWKVHTSTPVQPQPEVITLVITKPSKRLEPSRKSKLGMAVHCSNGGKMTVASIDPKGPFAKTKLEVGMIILTVNGKAYRTYSEGYNMLSDASGRVTIRACEPANRTARSAYTGSALDAFAGADVGGVDCDCACDCVIS